MKDYRYEEKKYQQFIDRIIAQHLDLILPLIKYKMEFVSSELTTPEVDQKENVDYNFTFKAVAENGSVGLKFRSYNMLRYESMTIRSQTNYGVNPTELDKLKSGIHPKIYICGIENEAKDKIVAYMIVDAAKLKLIADEGERRTNVTSFDAFTLEQIHAADALIVQNGFPKFTEDFKELELNKSIHDLFTELDKI